MRPAIPHMQARGHALLLERRDETPRLLGVGIVAARRDDDLGLAERLEGALVLQVRDKGQRVHVVRLSLTRAAQPARRVVRAGETDRLARDAGTAGRERERVERTE